MIWSRIRNAIARRRRGAVALVAVAGMLPVAGMLTASMNSSQMVDDRRATQDAADALSRMHGLWSARSMNILAMNSVTETQLITVALGSESLNGTLIEQQLYVALAVTHITTHGAQECQSRLPYGIDSWWVPVCWGIHIAAMIPAGIAEYRLIKIGMDYDPPHGIEVARRGLEAIEGMNRAIIERLPRSVHEIGEDYQDILELDEFHYDNPCDSDLAQNCESGRTHDGMALPIEEGGMTANLARCLVMNQGTTIRSTSFYQRGFPINQGPLDHDGSTSVRDYINDETGVGEMLHDFKEAYDDGGVAHLLPKWLFIGVTEHPDWANLQGEQDEDGPNSFTRRFDAKLGLVCIGVSLDSPAPAWLSGALPILETELPTVWELPGIDPMDFFPPIQPDDMPEEFQILALTLREKSTRLGSQVFVNTDEPHNAYSQTGLYNPDGADIYSGNWRYRLMTSMRLEEPGEVANRMDSRAPTEFSELVDVIDAIGDLNSWGRINAH